MSDTLPGEKRVYCVRNGEGDRYVFGGQLATLIARAADTGGLLEAAVISGGKGASFPSHRHARSHEAILVLDGTVAFSIGGRHHELERGSYVSIPPGTVHGYELRSHRTRFLSVTIGGDAGSLYATIGDPYAGYVHPAEPADPTSAGRMAAAASGLDIVFDGDVTTTASVVQAPPPGRVPFILPPGEGERMLAGDQLFALLGHQGNSDGQFIALTTQGPKGERIPKHFHEKHTETFLCLDGAMTMWNGDEEIAMYPGDFLHVPAGSVHSYRLDAPYTSFVGFLAPGLFEPFFRALCEPYEGHIFPLEPGPIRFDRVMQKIQELDLTLVERPGPPPAR